MSLSWKDEHPFAPRTSFDVFGKDLKQEAAPVMETASVREVASKEATTAKEIEQKEKKKCWLLRPVAWLVLLLSVCLMNSIINIVFLLCEYVVRWLSTLPTLAVVLLSVAFGGIAISLMFTGAMSLLGLVVTASHAVYPSKKGVRFYIVGATQLLISLLAIISAIAYPVYGRMFWDVAAPAYFAIVYIIMMCSIKSVID